MYLATSALASSLRLSVFIFFSHVLATLNRHNRVQLTQLGTFNSSKRSLRIRSSTVESTEHHRSKVFSHRREWGYHQ